MEASMTMYDYAKQVVANEVPMDGILFNKKVFEVANKMLSAKYWMLLCRERYDFTVFKIGDKTKDEKIVKELVPTLKNRGDVLLIDEQPDGAFEIWIRNPETNEDVAYYLFNYEDWMVYCDE